MKKSIVIFVIVTIWTAAPGLAEDPIVIAVDQANAPFMYARGTDAEGLYPKLVQAAFETLHIPVTIRPLPWLRALQMADQGKIGIAGIYKNSKRLLKYDYSEELFREKIVLYVRPGDSFSFTRLEDLYGKTIGVIRGWSYGNKIDRAREEMRFQLEASAGDEQNFKKLILNRLDCVLTVEQTGELLSNRDLFHGKVQRLPRHVTINATYLIFPKSADQTETLAQFNEALRVMKANGTYQRLVTSFFSNQ